jgi:hypothetical protein
MAGAAGLGLATGLVKTYESEQFEAKAAKRGIWAGSFTRPGNGGRSTRVECGKATGQATFEMQPKASEAAAAWKVFLKKMPGPIL